MGPGGGTVQEVAKQQLRTGTDGFEVVTRFTIAKHVVISMAL